MNNLRFLLKPHDVIAAVHVEGFAGDGAGQVGGEEEGCAADFELVNVAVERGAVGVGLEHVAEGSDAAGGQGLDGTGGDGVDANISGAEVPGKIADGGFKRGLGDAHDIVVGDDLLGAEVSEGDDAAAFGHQGSGGAADGDEGVDADVVGDAEALAGGREELAAEFFYGRIGDGVDKNLDLAVFLLEGGKEGFDLMIV